MKEILQMMQELQLLFKELGDRIIVWENFMKKYPDADKDLKKKC